MPPRKKADVVSLVDDDDETTEPADSEDYEPPKDEKKQKKAATTTTTARGAGAGDKKRKAPPADDDDETDDDSDDETEDSDSDEDDYRSEKKKKTKKTQTTKKTKKAAPSSAAAKKAAPSSAAAKKKAPAAAPSSAKKQQVKLAPFSTDEPKERWLEPATGYWIDPTLPLIWTTVGADGQVGAKVEARGKIAAFDLDGTLVSTHAALTGGSSVPFTHEDWVLFNPRVPEVVQKYYKQGYEIAIVSNQGGVVSKLVGKMAQKVKARAHAVALALGVPCSILMCPARSGDCPFRKPGTGMWTFLEGGDMRGPGAPPVDRAASVYVGDAAGRDGDHGDKNANSDRRFAEALGVPFLTPEECFGALAGPGKGKVALGEEDFKAGAAAVKAAGAGDEEAAGPNGALLMAALIGVSRRIFQLAKDKPECFPGGDEGAKKWRFKAVAYQNAAASIAGGFHEKITAQNLKKVGALPKVGKGTLEKLKECLETGKVAIMDELEAFEAAGGSGPAARVPEHVQQMQAAAAAFM
jgi:DNA 3'-phosphatase